MRSSSKRVITGVPLAVFLAVLVSASSCSSTKAAADGATPSTTASTTSASSASTAVPSGTVGSTAPIATGRGETATFKAEVWADNWFALFVNGELVGQDSVPITTERSFNAETVTFTATYPLLVAMITKDYKETDSGLEYIGTPRQQLGDGGFIAQFTNTDTGRVVAATGPDWRGLIIHRAPLNPGCVTSAQPDTDCRSEITAEPPTRTAAGFDDTAWPTATVYTAAEVGAKDGYDTVRWDAAASLIWTSDLKIDNTILWRHVIER